MVELPSANNLAAQGSGDLDIANFPPLRAATQVDFAGAGSSAGSGGDLLVNVETVAVADVIDSAAAGFEPVETVGRTVDIVVGVPDNLVPVASGADVGVNVGGDIAIYDGHRCVPICDVVGTAEIVQSNMDQIEAIGSQSHGLFSGIEGQRLDTFQGISAELIRHFTMALGEVDGNVAPISDEFL
ncbi:hypothetical protein V6N11_082923 [Hibiscus sabdariffa]|uniref:Uncharacterized protein n=1 Tax=Hibiscus sabdariffa TaxID=183260 RepID=A0ABR2QKW3_9ROSI